MNNMNLIDSCQAHMTVQYTSNIELIRRKWQSCRDWQRATQETHVQNAYVQNKRFACSIGSSWLFHFNFRFTLRQNRKNDYIINTKLF